MKPHEVTITGRTNTKGKPLLYNKEDMDNLLSLWPDTQFTMEITVFPKKTSGSQIGYYKKAILPALVRGWRDLGSDFSTIEADVQIRKLSPVCHKMTEDGEVVVAITSLTMNEMSEHIEFCIRTAAQEMGVSIPNPKY